MGDIHWHLLWLLDKANLSGNSQASTNSRRWVTRERADSLPHETGFDAAGNAGRVLELFTEHPECVHSDLESIASHLSKTNYHPGLYRPDVSDRR